MTSNLQIWLTKIDELNNDVLILHNDKLQLLINEKQYQYIQKFVFIDDRKRALLSLFLQRKIIENTFQLSSLDYEILRIKEGKPYVHFFHDYLRGNTFNYNVSHHGKYVAIAADSNTLVGIDIVDITSRSNVANSASELSSMFDNQFTKYEIDSIQQQDSEDTRYRMFYILWSLKESFVKAIGKGLGFNLLDIEFSVSFSPEVGKYSSDIIQGRADIRGVPPYLIDNKDWSFSFTSIDQAYIITLARGPLSAALPTYQNANHWDLNSLQAKSIENKNSMLSITEIDIILKDPLELLSDII